MGSIGDMYEVDLSGNILGQTTHNIFHYVLVSGTGDASDLNDIFKLQIVTNMANIQSSDATNTNTRIVNLDDAGDFYLDSFSVPGVRSGISSSPFNAWGFTYNPADIHAKSGGKRVAGVAIADVTDGRPVSGALTTNLGILAGKFGGALNTGTGVFRPRILSERCVKDPVTHRCTSAPHVFYRVPVESASFDVQTTQSSRKWRTRP